MIRHSCLLNTFVLVAALSSAACKRDEPSPAPAAAPTPVPEAVPQLVAASAAPSASAAPAVPKKPDPINPESLKEGMAIMLPRVLAEGDTPGKLTPNERSRLFMHPAETKSVVLEFDTKGLTSLTLSPFMEDFSSDVGCLGNPEAGVVRLTWSVDGGKKSSVTVDRDYKSLVDVPLKNSSRLKVEVDKGNAVTYCDWASLGILNVK